MIRAIAVSLALFLLSGFVPSGFLPFGAQAQERAPVQLNFAVYAAGLNVLDIQSGVDLHASGYRVDLSFRTVGLFGLLFHSEVHSLVQGGWIGPGLAPLQFSSWGTLLGSPRRTVIDYVRGQPLVRTLEPADDKDRDPVPVDMQRDTIDTLSAMVLLVRQVAATGRCDGHASTFDGRRVANIESRTVGDEVLKADGRSSFSGVALRCEIDGQQVAGFQHDADADELRKIHHNTAWLAQLLPGGPSLPVRVVFETRFFGHATAFLTGMATGVVQ